MPNYEGLLKQIADGDFSESEITNLILSLSAKRKGKTVSAKDILLNPNAKQRIELDGETKAIMRKCKENRSEVFCCPHCGSIGVVKNGTRNGRQRYKCKDCGKTFGDTYGTVLYKSKLSIERWKALLSHTLHNDSVRFIRKQTDMNHRTILYNRHRIAELLKVLASNMDDFESIVQADEYYIPLSFKDVKDPTYFVSSLGRMPNTHLSRNKRYKYIEDAGYSKDMVTQFDKEKEEEQECLKVYLDGVDLKSSYTVSSALNKMTQENVQKVLGNLDSQQKKKRGLSYQQVCILSCVDNIHNHYLSPACLSRPEPKHIEDGIVPHLTDKENMILVTDGLRAYRTVANKNKIHLRQIPSGKHSSGPFNLGLINGYHSNLKMFMDNYKEIASKYVDNYMALFYWQEKNKRNSIATMVESILGVMTMPMKSTKLHEFKYKDLPFDTKDLPFADEYKAYWEHRRKIDIYKKYKKKEPKKE